MTDRVRRYLDLARRRLTGWREALLLEEMDRLRDAMTPDERKLVREEEPTHPCGQPRG